MIDDFSEYYEATEPGRCERAHAWAMAIGLHRQDAVANDGVNDGVKSVLNPTEEKAIKALLRNSTTLAEVKLPINRLFCTISLLYWAEYGKL